MNIPDDIMKALEAHVKKEKKFQTVDEYVLYLLRQVVEKLDRTPTQFSKDEESKVMERLKALGYLD